MILDRVHPVDMWLNADILCEMLDALEAEEIHSITVNYRGRTVLEGSWEPFTLYDNQMMHSLSKLGVSICTGYAVAEGRLSLSDRMVDYLHSDLPASYDSAIELITIEDLLTMRAGSAMCCNNVWFSALDGDWQREWLKQHRLRDDIGKVFHYDSGCSYTLSRIISKVMGRSCLELLEERIFSKMGLGHVDWLTAPDGENTGGWGMYLTSRRIAVLGDLLVKGGWWYGEQLIPAWWVEELSRPRVNIPQAEGRALDSYGYHIKAGKEIYAAEGAFGQFLICFRNQPVSIGITAGTEDSHAPEICLEYIRKAIELPCATERIPLAEKRLASRLSSLSLPLPEGDCNPAGVIDAILERRISFSDNPRDIRSAFFYKTREKELVLRLDIAGEEKLCLAGYGKWIRNNLYPGDFTRETHAISYAFNKDALEIHVGLVNTSYYEKYTLRMDYGLKCSWKPNVTYLPHTKDMEWHFRGSLESLNADLA